MPESGGNRYVAPVFEEYTFNDLAERTGYSIPYLYEFAVGRVPLKKRFKFVVSRVLQRSEEELFGPSEEKVAADG